MIKERKLINIIFDMCKAVGYFKVLESIEPDIFLCLQIKFVTLKVWKISPNYYNDICMNTASMLRENGYNYCSSTLSKEEIFKLLPDNLKQIVLFNMDEFNEKF